MDQLHEAAHLHIAKLEEMLRVANDQTRCQRERVIEERKRRRYWEGVAFGFGVLLLVVGGFLLTFIHMLQESQAEVARLQALPCPKIVYQNNCDDVVRKALVEMMQILANESAKDIPLVLDEVLKAQGR